MKFWWHRHKWQVTYRFESQTDKTVLYHLGNTRDRFGYLCYQECRECGERRAITAGFAPWMDEFFPPPIVVDKDYINYKIERPSSPIEIYNGMAMYKEYSWYGA